ncbi:hypothetical protein M422DRAFT_264038 [Sphaerobolus stellatus SS14]|uniref:Nephrocystin 3-like N-terminal domain-containing protein n=1 Tax=Sphaerobolus stellatus (strain SS14) TaxID=990650 RepID=A0A0C9V900_SPHS4|nr:hypothetical protein M422DRAFT_264038 [Sphaerobolus stellatus SS14]
MLRIEDVHALGMGKDAPDILHPLSIRVRSRLRIHQMRNSTHPSGSNEEGSSLPATAGAKYSPLPPSQPRTSHPRIFVPVVPIVVGRQVYNYHAMHDSMPQGMEVDALKAVKHIFSSVDDAVKNYVASFAKLQVAFTDAAVLSTQLDVMKLTVDVINITASLAALYVDVNLNDMPYAEGARYKSGKGCIQGTRVKVLDVITHRRLQLYLPTLARDLAHRDPHIKKSLGHVIEDPSLRKTDDLGDQFDHFITQTVQGCSFIGPILIVIDALDECGDGKPRKEFLNLLSNPETMKKLPSNFRIFITSRPDQDVQKLFSKMHILQLQDKQYKENVDKDIFSFVYKELLGPPPPLEDITEDHCKQIVNKSEGLFQWASVACQFVQDEADSAQSPTYALKQILSSGSGLYKLYTATLNNRFKRIKDTSFNQRFKKVLGFILGVNKPLPKTSLSLLWRLRFEKEISVDMDFILSHLGSLFNGLGDTAVVSPIHTSVWDFFTSPEDSGAFFIKTEEHHFDISLGCYMF